MRNRVVCLLGLAIVATPLAAGAAEAQAPPTLTPLAARAVAVACPGTEAYAQALVRGITEADAARAAVRFDACASEARRAFSPFPERAANTAVGAAYLSLGLLRRDPALLRRSIDATAELRKDTPAPDEEIRRWPIIPDQFDVFHRVAIVRTDCPADTLAADAAYINVAAHAGSAWVAAPREPSSCSQPLRYTDLRTIPVPWGDEKAPARSSAPRPPAREPDVGSPFYPG